MPATVLIVEDEKHTREGLRQALDDQYDVFLARDAEDAFRLLALERFDVILTDLRMAGESGMSVIDRALEQPNQPICIMMTAYGNVETAVEAMKRGAFDFLTKPVNLEKLELVIKRALKAKKLEAENEDLHARLDAKYSFGGIVGSSKPLLDVLDQVKQVAPSKATLLLEGETGTGKELIAELIHQNSLRARKPFVAVHCAALPSNLLESELFGHEKGAFTGAAERRIGRFEAANGGTLFLDEIGEIDASTQVKLLRFLESRTFERVGSVKPLTVDVRLVCATNRDLEAMVKKGDFREDLLYRLNVIPIHLPSLRERSDDIPLLLDHYMKRFAMENEVEQPRLSAETLKILQAYRWPGNIRELRNFCENCVVMRHGAEIKPSALNAKFLDRPDVPAAPRRAVTLSRDENEKKLIGEALERTRGNKTEAAELLGVSRRTLHRKLKQWPDLLNF